MRRLRSTVAAELPDGRVARVRVLVLVDAHLGLVLELDLVRLDDEVDREAVGESRKPDARELQPRVLSDRSSSSST